MTLHGGKPEGQETVFVISELVQQDRSFGIGSLLVICSRPNDMTYARINGVVTTAATVDV
jgi:hypothetical protein